MGQANEQSKEIQSMNAVQAISKASCSTCILSFFCSQARAAHTMDKTGVLSYWAAFVSMLCCPICTVCGANACTDMNEKLGGEKAGLCTSWLCTWCCMCCVVAQDATSLDLCTGAESGICGVQQAPGMATME